MAYTPSLKSRRNRQSNRIITARNERERAQNTPVQSRHRSLLPRRRPDQKIDTKKCSVQRSDQDRIAEGIEACRTEATSALVALKTAAADADRDAMTAADFRWLKRLERQHICDLRRLHKAVKNPRLFQRYAADILSSFPSTMTAAAIAVQKKSGGAITRNELETLAKDIQTSRRPRPTASWRADKGNGEFRIITSWNARDYGQQVLVSHILLASIGVSEFDFAAPQKGGRNAAIKTMAKAIRNGCTHWAYADIRDAYGCIRPAHLLNLLPAPRRMVNIAFPSIDRATRSTPLNGIRRGDPETSSRGLPQGARSSATIQSAVVSTILRAQPELTRVHIGYADDMANGAHTHKQAEEMGNMLAEAFASHAPGALWLRVQVQDVDSHDGVNFLGYRLNRLRPSSSIYIRAANKSWTKWHRKARKFLRHEYNNSPSLTDSTPTLADRFLLRKTLSHIRRWRRAHPLWQTRSFTRWLLRNNAEQAVEEFLACENHRRVSGRRN